jgi:uncharacterized protein
MDDVVVVARIFIKECDRGRKKSLMDEVLDILRDRQAIHSAVVFRGIAGFDAGGDVHRADMLRLMVDLPLVIEFFDKPAAVEAAIGSSSHLVPAGQIVQWPARCSNLSAQ